MAGLEPKRAEEFLNVFARIAFGHHGTPPSKVKGEFRALFSASDVAAAVHYADDLLETFLSSESLEEIAQFVKRPEDERESTRNHLITASWRLAGMTVLCDWVASGGFFPFVEEELPMATSNAMYERMAKIYHLFFAEDHPPSLVLSHGARHLSETFRRSYSQLHVPVHETGTQYEDRAPRCSEWLANSTKKALLADVGIGTLDQVLLGALRVRFQTLRALGMSSKVMVVDEVHAYDPYMRRVLESVLTHHAQMGLPVVLLSATLPRTILSKLCRAYHSGIENRTGSVEVPTEYGFPLVTRVDATGIQQYEIEPRRESVRSLPVEFLDSTDGVYRQIRSAHEQGKCVCWIRNTISDILEAHEELRNVLPEGVVDVFHSRFAMTEAAILAAGYAPAIGFIHTGKPLSFVYDIADLFKAEMVLPLAFKLAARNPPKIDRAVRLGCRDAFREKKLLKRIIPSIEEALAAGEIGLPEAPPDAVLPAIPAPEGIGDAGHRNK